MAVTQERILALVNAATRSRDACSGVRATFREWEQMIAKGELALTVPQLLSAAITTLDRLSPSSEELAVIRVEELHFQKRARANEQAKARMRTVREAIREGSPLRGTRTPAAPERPRGRPVVDPNWRPNPADFTEAELAAARHALANKDEAERLMQEDKARLAARKPKPLPFALPRAAPMNPYENDGMPEHPPGVTAEDLLRAEAEARARANKKGDNSPSQGLTTEPTRATIQTSEQGIPPEPDQAP